MTTPQLLLFALFGGYAIGAIVGYIMGYDSGYDAGLVAEYDDTENYGEET